MRGVTNLRSVRTELERAYQRRGARLC